MFVSDDFLCLSHPLLFFSLVWTRHLEPDIWRYLHVVFESEFENNKFDEPRGKKKEEQAKEICFLVCFSLCRVFLSEELLVSVFQTWFRNSLTCLYVISNFLVDSLEPSFGQN